MPSVGERLRDAREARETTLDRMADATGIGPSYLEALERGRIDALPGPAFGKLYIRAYAEVLGFDPQPWIEDYDREQRREAGASGEPASAQPSRPRPVAEAIARWKESRLPADPPADPVEPEPAVDEIPPAELVSETPPALGPAPKARRPAAVLLVAATIAIAAVLYVAMRGTGADRTATAMGEPPAAVSPQALVPLPEHTAPAPSEPRERPAAKPPVTRSAGEASALAVSEFGVGRRVVDLRLEGEGDRFERGARLCFATRVLGGRRGDLVRHVWLHDGKVEQTIALRLGGADWRTHSNKTLGRAGAWVVEARDDAGAVLARVAFTCEPERQAP